jgi:hypothetical protein
MNYSDLSPPELFSICAHGGDVASWKEFVRRFNPVIARSVIRVALRHGTADNSLIDDLVQESELTARHLSRPVGCKFRSRLN